MKKIFLALFALSAITAQAQSKKECTGEDACCKKMSKSTVLVCKLTTPELRLRKETVIKSLKDQIIQKKELKSGYQFTFPGTDKMIDELTEFVKTERACCDFFTFSLKFSGDKSQAILEITGPKGAKEFINTELAM